MRLLASMDSHMNSQSGPLNELFSTARMLTDVGPNTAMYTFWRFVSTIRQSDFDL